MAAENVSRRNFSKLAIAAAGGILAGSQAAMAAEGSGKKKKKGKKGKKMSGKDFPVDPALLLSDPNVCKGLNSCKGKGKGDHSCAGQGSCATVEAHGCNGHNACKGRGGCGGYPGQNSCKAQGHCSVPLSEKSWGLARKQFEHLMKDMDKKFGAVPA